MWSASIYHHALDMVFSDSDVKNTLISLTVALGIGLNDNTITVELAGEWDIPTGIMDATFQWKDDDPITFYGFELTGELSYNVIQERIISTNLEGAFGDTKPTLLELIAYLEENGLPSTQGVNLVKAERGASDCLAETVTDQALVEVVLTRLKQTTVNPTEFYKTLDIYGLGFIQTDSETRELAFINEPITGPDGEHIEFTALITGDYKFNKPVHNRPGDFLIRKIVGQGIGVTDAKFIDGTLEPEISVKNPQVGTFNRTFTILSERDKLRNKSDNINGVTFELNPSILPRHLFYRPADKQQYLVRQVTHKFTPAGHSTKIDGSFYQVFTQPDTVEVTIDRKQGRVKDYYTVPMSFLPKTLNKNDSTNIDDWTFNVNLPTNTFETLTEDGMVYDIKDVPFVDDRVRAAVSALDCPEPGSESYQWFRVTVSEFGIFRTIISQANFQSYTVTMADVGLLLECKVTYTNTSGAVVNATPPGTTKRVVQRNVPGTAQIVLGDIDTILPFVALMSRMIASVGITGAFITGVGAAVTFETLAAGVGRAANLSAAASFRLAGTFVRVSPTRFVGPWIGLSLPLAFYSAFHGAALVSSLEVTRD